MGIGAQWRRDVAFAGFEVPIQMDVSAEKMIFGVGGIDPERRAELIKVGWLNVFLNSYRFNLICTRLLSFICQHAFVNVFLRVR